MRDVDGSHAPVCICVTVCTRTEGTIYGVNMLNNNFGRSSIWGSLSVTMRGPNFLPDQKGSVFQWLLSWEKHCNLSLYWWHGSSFFFLLCCLAFRSFFICRRSLRLNRFLNRAILILLLRSCRIWRARCLRACRICFFCNFFRVILFLSLFSHL